MPRAGFPALKALSAPFGDVRFCPTGGITLETAPDWLALESVLCVGGSWLVPKGPPDYVAVAEAARKAGAARTMRSVSDLLARLEELRERTNETPLFNPAFQVSLELSREIESGALTLDMVAANGRRA